nr:MAG: glutamine amidotransferases class-II [Bacteriophage sp.]
MCVIVTAVPGAMPEPEDILAMSEANPDGGGVSWWDGERLRVFKNIDPLKVVGFIFSHWEQLRNAPCLIHFRLATHGAVEPRNCHPFYTDRGYIAHNGIAYRHVRLRLAKHGSGVD